MQEVIEAPNKITPRGHPGSTTVAFYKALKYAIESDELSVWYQPQMNLASRHATSFEALVRWNHPEWGFIPADVIVGAAESYGLMDDLFFRVLHAACLEASSWPNSVRLCVNVMPYQLSNNRIVSDIVFCLRRFNFDPSRLEIEVVESTELSLDTRTLTVLGKLKTLGITFAIDDFGKGYSNFVLIKKLDFSKIKIDREFIRDIVTCTKSKAIVNSIMGLSRSINVSVIAEGIETADQMRLVRELGCQMGQGFMLGRPAPPEHIANFLSSS